MNLGHPWREAIMTKLRSSPEFQWNFRTRLVWSICPYSNGAEYVLSLTYFTYNNSSKCISNLDKVDTSNIPMGTKIPYTAYTYIHASVIAKTERHIFMSIFKILVPPILIHQTEACCQGEFSLCANKHLLINTQSNYSTPQPITSLCVIHVTHKPANRIQASM